MEDKYLHFSFSDGINTLNMGCGEVIKVVSFKGLESPTYSIHTSSNATQDGLITTGKKVNERVIDIIFGIDDIKQPSTYRRKVEAFFNGKKSFKLKVCYIYNKAIIDFEVQDFYWSPLENLWDYIEGNISLLCPYPYWSDLDDFGKNIAGTTPQFTFPLVLSSFNENGSSAIGKAMSYTSLTNEVNLFNKGDVETGLHIKFIAKKGPVINPKIIKETTGEYIDVICNMVQGDIVEINTNPGQKSIMHNGVNIFKQKTKLSTFFNLDVNDNIVSYSALENQTNLEIRIYYTPKYLGV